MGKILLGIIVGLILFPVLAFAYFQVVTMPAAVADKPFPLEKFFAGGALHAVINKEAPRRDLASFSKDDVVAGAAAYSHSDCQECHGFPAGVPPRETHVLYPPAPLLFTPDGNVADDNVGITYWKVKNGIRLSGMPSYASRLSDQEMWRVAAFVANAEKEPPEAIDALQRPQTPPAVPAGADAAPQKQKK